MGYKEKTVDRVVLASNPKYWVELSTDMLWGSMKKVADVNDDGKLSYQVDALLLMAIVAWNLDDDNGETLPITQENIDSLKRADIETIIYSLGGKLEEPKDVKKDS